VVVIGSSAAHTLRPKISPFAPVGLVGGLRDCGDVAGEHLAGGRTADEVHADRSGPHRRRLGRGDDDPVELAGVRLPGLVDDGPVGPDDRYRSTAPGEQVGVRRQHAGRQQDPVGAALDDGGQDLARSRSGHGHAQRGAVVERRDERPSALTEQAPETEGRAAHVRLPPLLG
jgi:hypothetical protein